MGRSLEYPQLPDVISSYEILPIGAGAGCLSFFEHPNYKGGTWQWCSGIAGFDSAAGSDWEDKLSSLQISPGYKVTLFEHPNEFGQTTCVPESTLELSNRSLAGPP